MQNPGPDAYMRACNPEIDNGLGPPTGKLIPGGTVLAPEKIPGIDVRGYRGLSGAGHLIPGNTCPGNRVLVYGYLELPRMENTPRPGIFYPDQPGLLVGLPFGLVGRTLAG